MLARWLVNAIKRKGYLIYSNPRVYALVCWRGGAWRPSGFTYDTDANLMIYKTHRYWQMSPLAAPRHLHLCKRAASAIRVVRQSSTGKEAKATGRCLRAPSF